MDYFVYTAEIEGVKRNCLALLPKETLANKGVYNQAIIGFLKTDKADPTEFEENQNFTDFFHGCISQALPLQDEFLNEGKKVKTGYVYAIDKRTKNPKGDVPMQDIIGAMNFENGTLVADSYLPNKNYKLFTKKGLFQLPYSLEEYLLNAITK